MSKIFLCAFFIMGFSFGDISNDLETVAILDHKPFGELLKKYVDDKGNVNYAEFKKDQDKLEEYINDISINKPGSTWPKNERLAFWINLYNAGTIKLILDNYPVSSIQDIEGGKPWDKLFLKVGPATYSLNAIENKVIRRQFTEPRIHFAVNCAAASCPPLLNDAYYPETLINQLAARTHDFIANSNYNTINENQLEISKIFDWYGEDFGNVRSYINSRTNVDVSSLSITYKEYDWSLNKQ